MTDPGFSPPTHNAASGAPETAPRAVRALGVQRKIGTCLTIGGLVAIAVITLTPAGSGALFSLWCLSCGERPAVDVLLNILLFVPLAVGLGLRDAGYRRALLYGILCSALVESLQFFIVPGRFPSVRDVLSNSMGVLLAYPLGQRWAMLVFPGVGQARRVGLTAAALWLGSQLFAAWAMGAAAPPPPWWAQLEPDYDGYPGVFRGKIVAVSIGSVAIAESDVIADAADARTQLLNGAPLRAALTGVSPTRGRAMILVISAGPARDVAYWEQDGRDAVFTVPVRATFAGFRTPSVRIADVVPPATRDTVTLSGAYANGRYLLRAERNGIALERKLDASASLTWALLLPLPTYAFGKEVRVVTAAWLAIAWALLGFWAARASRGRAPYAAVIGAALVMIAGLAGAPLAFDLPVAHWSEWVAAAAGLAAGWLLVSARGRAPRLRAPERPRS